MKWGKILCFLIISLSLPFLPTTSKALLDCGVYYAEGNPYEPIEITHEDLINGWTDFSFQYLYWYCYADRIVINLSSAPAGIRLKGNRYIFDTYGNPYVSGQIEVVWKAAISFGGSVIPENTVIRLYENGVQQYEKLLIKTQRPSDTTPPDTSIISNPSGNINYNNVAFTWTGSDDATQTSNLLYSYKLEGYDSDWSDYGSSTSKTYNGLPNNSYTFKVRAKDAAGNIDPSPASQSFTVNVSSCTSSNPSGCLTEPACQDAGGYWYDGLCYADLCCVTEGADAPPQVVVGDTPNPIIIQRGMPVDVPLLFVGCTCTDKEVELYVFRADTEGNIVCFGPDGWESYYATTLEDFKPLGNVCMPEYIYLRWRALENSQSLLDFDLFVCVDDKIDGIPTVGFIYCGHQSIIIE